MDYKVMDEKGIAYTDNQGRHVIERNGTIPQRLIDNNSFTQGCINRLITDKRIVELSQSEPLKYQDKKAEIKEVKRSKKK